MKNALEKNMEDFFSENGAETIAAMTGMISAQQNIALNLTKLVLEYCVKDDKITKEQVFDIYEEACDLLKEQVE